MLLAATLMVQGLMAQAEEPARESELVWLDDYYTAYQQAKEEKKFLFVYLARDDAWATQQRFEQSLGDAVVGKSLASMVLLKLPTSATLKQNDQETRLLDHSAFRYLYGSAGFAILDLAHPDDRFFGYVVSAFPFHDAAWVTPQSLRTILSLPAGSLTQRTMVYAVRMHGERPASTGGKLSTVLVDAAESHSRHQASINLQGHHNWETRFHQIHYRLGRYQPPVEVCAESWPGKRLVDACIDCVDSWRQSSGHWNAVRSPHSVYGYDIKMGSNGIWYATGIFAD